MRLLDTSINETSKWHYAEIEEPRFAYVDYNIVNSGRKLTSKLAANRTSVIPVPSYSHDVELKGSGFSIEKPRRGDNPIHTFEINGQHSATQLSSFSTQSVWQLPSYLTSWFTDYSVVVVTISVQLNGQCSYSDMKFVVDVGSWLENSVVTVIDAFPTRSGRYLTAALKVVGGYVASGFVPTVKLGLSGSVQLESLPDSPEVLTLKINVLGCNSFEDVLPALRSRALPF